MNQNGISPFVLSHSFKEISTPSEASAFGNFTSEISTVQFFSLTNASTAFAKAI